MKIICIGKNYSAHIEEMKSHKPEFPIFFLKPDTAIVIRNRPFFLPDLNSSIDFETELIYKICKVGKHISEKYAHTYYKEIGIGIDFTARDLQKKCIESGKPWEICKAFDNSAIISNFVPITEINDINNINFKLYKNGELVQIGNSSEMIFNINQIISYISKFITLKLGDIIYTGTPSGVGPVKIGDRLEAWLEDKKMLDFMVK